MSIVTQTAAQKSADSLQKYANTPGSELVLAGKGENKHLNAKKFNWFCRFVRKILPSFFSNWIFKSDPKKIVAYINNNPQIFHELKCPWKIDQVAEHLRKKHFKTTTSKDSLQKMTVFAKQIR